MHPVIALWVHPRSMSTAVERLMRERGDLHCLHEPFMYHYYINQQHRQMPFFEPQQDHPVSYPQVRDHILEKAEQAPVFFKDMSYYITAELQADTAFSRRLTHCFLIRNPKAAIASYYQLDNELTRIEIGLESQWQHYAHLRELGLNPVVLQAETIRKDLRGSITDWWDRINLPLVESAFSWDDQHPHDWNQVKTWHRNSIASRTIRAWRDADTELENQRFEAAAKAAPRLRDYLAHHWPFYQKLQQQAR